MSWDIRTVGDLKKALSEFPDNFQIRILDSFNGGGMARVINLGPIRREGDEGEEVCDDNDQTESDKNEVGQPVVVMGYGYY